MRTVNFDDIDDLPGTATPPGDDAGTPAVPENPAFTVPAAPRFTMGPGDWPDDAQYQHECRSCGHAFLGHKGRIRCSQCQPRLDPNTLDSHETLTFGPLEDDLQDIPAAPEAGEAPADLSRSIHAANQALQSPSAHLGIAVQTVLENYGRLTPGQVEALHGCLMELGADLDDDAEAGGRYGPAFDMTAFIQRMITTIKKIEKRLYTPGTDGMEASYTSQELQAITNGNKNLLTMIARNHDKVMGWERQRAIEAAHLAAARELPVDLQDKYMATLQAELESRGL